jgi:hypothetical protein
VQCALALLLLAVTVAGFGCAGARVDVAQQAPSEVPQPDFIIVERFGVSPEDVKLDRGLSAQALRGFQERALNDEERKVGAAVATIMEEELVRLLAHRVRLSRLAVCTRSGARSHTSSFHHQEAL